MKIFGLGTDIVNIKRLEKILKKKIIVLSLEFFLKMKFYIVIKKIILFHFMQKDMQQKKR